MLTTFGAILLPFAIFLFLFRPNLLLPATIFFAGFFKFKVISIPGVATGLTAFMLLGGLLTLHQLTKIKIHKASQIRIPLPYLLAALFFMACLASLPMAAIYSGKILIAPMDVNYTDYKLETLKFTKRNITQILYPLTNFIIFIAISSSITTTAKLISSIKAVFYSFFAILSTGVFYQTCLGLGKFGFATQFFSLFTGTNELRTLEIQFGLPRMYSLAGEPGYSASFFIATLGITLFMSNIKSWGYTIKSTLTTKYCYPLNILACILTGGTTGFLGLTLFIPLKSLITKKFHLTINPKSILLTTSFTILIVLLIFKFNADETFGGIIEYHTSKITATADKGSGQVRANTMIEGFRVFTESPLLGSGYGSHRTTALLTSLLSNVGLIGTITFLWFVLYILSKSLIEAKNKNLFHKQIALTLATSYLAFLATCMVGKSLVTLLFPWTWTTLAILCANIYLRPNIENENSI